MQMRLGSSGFFVAVEEEPTRSVSTTQRCLIRIIGNDYTFNEMLFHFFMPFFFLKIYAILCFHEIPWWMLRRLIVRYGLLAETLRTGNNFYLLVCVGLAALVTGLTVRRKCFQNTTLLEQINQ